MLKMDDNTKALKIIAIHALQALLTSDDEPLIKVEHEPDIGKNIFSLTFGAPESDWWRCRRALSGFTCRNRH